MGQEFNVVRCFQCNVFQVQQVKKSKKWTCKMCGAKQSLKKIYGQGSGADCRRHVQKLNMMRGDTEEREDAANDECGDDEDDREIWQNDECQGGGTETPGDFSTAEETKWAQFLDANPDGDASYHDEREKDEISCTTDRNEFDGIRRANCKQWRNRRWGGTGSSGSEFRGGRKWGRKRQRHEENDDGKHQDHGNTDFHQDAKRTSFQRYASREPEYQGSLENRNIPKNRTPDRMGSHRGNITNERFQSQRQPKPPTLNSKPATSSKWSTFLPLCEEDEEGNSQLTEEHASDDTPQYYSGVRNTDQQGGASKWAMFVTNECALEEIGNPDPKPVSVETKDDSPTANDSSCTGTVTTNHRKNNSFKATDFLTSKSATFEVDDELDSILDDF